MDDGNFFPFIYSIKIEIHFVTTFTLKQSDAGLQYCCGRVGIGSPCFVGDFLPSHITPLFSANWHIILIQEKSLANCKARHRWWHFLKRLAKVVESRPNFRPRIREAKKKGANEVIYSPDSEEEGRNPFLAVLRQVTWDFQLGVREKKVLFPIEYDLRNSRRNYTK